MHDRPEDHVLADLLEAHGDHVGAAELRRPNVAVLSVSLADWLAGNTPGERARKKARDLLAKR